MRQQLLDAVADAILDADIRTVTDAVRAAMAGGLNRHEILNEGILPGLDRLGAGFQDGTYYVADMIVSSAAVKKALSLMKGCKTTNGQKRAGRVLIGTVEGDLHDIGKNLVVMMLRSYGFDVVDLGVDVSGEMFLEALRRYPDTKILALSALLTTTLPVMQADVETLRRAFPERGFQIMVGGAPVTKAFADSIGADIYTANAVEAAEAAARMIQ